MVETSTFPFGLICTLDLLFGNDFDACLSAWLQIPSLYTPYLFSLFLFMVSTLVLGWWI